jgi:hypothetical protein
MQVRLQPDVSPDALTEGISSPLDKCPSILDIFETYSLALAQSFPGRLDSAKKPWVMYETILKPVVFRAKSDQYPSRFSMPCNHDLLGLGKTQEL